ncbi:MAG: methionine--tRNA ligase [Candidatus Aenigmarchaeota archaeon]|nr:methionine--tRNA ligase [Candidatus Aenigmarchaeota archaeon]MDW8149431.1 methionine--tRNA ligase [Candidatus Aenigmarchaeota archaeon]
MTKKILVLCALPYTNNVPHIGNIVGSHLPADIFARFCRMKNYETLFVGGADENGSPSEITALELRVDIKNFLDTLYPIHKKIYEWFNISYDIFSRTSKEIHHKVVKEFFLKIYENGFISEEEITLPFCENCKIFLPDRYVEGICPNCKYEKARGDQCENCSKILDPVDLINPKCKLCNKEPVFRKEKHLFLDLNKLENKIVEWIKSKEGIWREHVISYSLGWLKEGLKKRCITRDLKLGVKVPLKGYENKVFYVWFDAPIGYISFTLETSQENLEKFWKDKNCLIYNFLGKDNIPFHTIFWPAMLMANGEYNLPYNVVGLNYCNYEGSKISKSRKWGIFCEKIIESGVDVDIWRYYLIHLIPETADTEFKWKEFQDKVNGELIGNLANFVYRVLSFLKNHLNGKIENFKIGDKEKFTIAQIDYCLKTIVENLENVNIREAFRNVLKIAEIGNKYFQENEPWNLLKSNKTKCKKVIFFSSNIVRMLAVVLYPFLPKTAERIFEQLNLKKEFKWEDRFEIKLTQHTINEPKPLFEKLDDKKIEKLKRELTEPINLKSFFKEEKISLDYFSKIKMRVGKILEVEKIPNSKKLLKLLVDFGDEKKQVISGISEYYKIDELIGKKFVFVVNIEKKKIMDFESEAMILAATNKEKISLITIDKDIEEGSEVH